MNDDTVMDALLRLDAWLPPEMAERAESIGVRKAGLDLWAMLVLGVLAERSLAWARSLPQL